MHVLDAAITATDVVSGCRLVKSPHYDHSLSLSIYVSLYLSLSTGFTNRYRVAQFTGRVQRFQPVRADPTNLVSKPTTAIQAVVDTAVLLVAGSSLGKNRRSNIAGFRGNASSSS